MRMNSARSGRSCSWLKAGCWMLGHAGGRSNDTSRLSTTQPISPSTSLYAASRMGMFFRLSTAWYTLCAATITYPTHTHRETQKAFRTNQDRKIISVINMEDSCCTSTSRSLWNRSSRSWEFGSSSFSINVAGSLVLICSTICSQNKKIYKIIYVSIGFF